MKKAKKNALFLWGPPGVGKTVAAYRYAEQEGYEILELNASDFRSGQQILDRVGSAIKQQSLFSKGKALIIDELDGISGQKDRGGIQALSRLIADSSSLKAPLKFFLIANDPWDKKFSSLRALCRQGLIEFKPLPPDALVALLQRIARQEGISVDLPLLRALARRSNGDARAAIQDFQAMALSSSSNLEDLGERLPEQSILQALSLIFKSRSAAQVKDAFEHVGLDLDQCLLWVEENLPREYQGRSLSQAFTALSKADVYRGRIRRQQHWRFLVYLSAHLTAGVALAKEEKRRGSVAYKKPERLLKHWISNQKQAKRDSIVEKLAAKAHGSWKRHLRDTYPYLRFMLRKQPQAFQKAFELEEDELRWLQESQAL